MKYGKWICLAVLVFSLSVGLCSCGSQTKETEIPEEAETSTEQTADSTTDDADAVTSTVDLDWKTITYRDTDSDGYQFEYTWTFSPWILAKNTDVTNAYWSSLGEEDSLPSFDDWDLQKSGTTYTRDGFAAKLTDMYYCIGTVSIKNVTDGWSITPDSPKSPGLLLCAENGLEDSEIIMSFTKYDELIMYYFSNNKKIDGVIRPTTALFDTTTAHMDSDKWGPCSFVIMAPEFFSPNTPDGVSKPLLKDNYFLFSETDKINVGVYE